MNVTPFDQDAAAFRSATRRFVERDLAKSAERWERLGRFPRRAVAACGRRGLLSQNAARTAIVAEELARCDSLGVTLSIFVQAGLVAPMLRELATGTQRRRWLSPVEAGRRIGAMAVTEPQAGSDFAALTCRAAPDRRGLVINGEKTYVTAAAAADFFIAAVRMDAGLSLLVVPADQPGVRVSPVPTLGLSMTAMGRISFRNCRVSADALLGDEGAGYGYVQDALNRERLYGGIGVIAWAERALDKTTQFLRDRRAFGRPLSRFQAIRHQLADLAAHVEAARQLNYATFARWQAGARVTKEIAMIKLFSYRVAQQVIETCLQLHGGLGYTADHWTSRWYRDARALTIAAGTPEVMRDLIAAHLRL
jgi:acyl-CoA dehydrogenase